MTDSMNIPPLWLIPGLPAIAALFIFIFSSTIRPKTAGWIASAGVGGAFLSSIYAFACLVCPTNVAKDHFLVNYWQWLNVGFIQANVGLLLDRISAVFH